MHLEGVTPGEFKQQGAGLNIQYAMHDTPFGNALIATTARGICSFTFMAPAELEVHLLALTKQWPQAKLLENSRATASVIKAMFNIEKNQNHPLSLHVSGTNFQISVWKALLQIAPATVNSYSQVARAIGRPKAARAVGSAIAANPIAFLIPCHRVIQESGRLGGYHWGETRMHAIHAWETARFA